MIMMTGDRFEQGKDGEKMIEEVDVNERGVLLDGKNTVACLSSLGMSKLQVKDGGNPWRGLPRSTKSE